MILEVKDIEVGYLHDIMILHGVSLVARDAKVTAVIGPNGAGKSTLLKTIYGYLKPKRGNIFYKGTDIIGYKPYELLKKGLAFVPQNRSVFPGLTVQENLELGTWIFRKDHQRVREAVGKVCERFPALAEKMKAKAGTLSGGQQRMLEIGRGLMANPDVLLLDEPTVGLAPKVAKEIYKTIASLCHNDGLTVVVVDQNVKSIMEVCDYVYVLSLGKNVIDGPKSKFKDTTELIKGWLIV